MLSSRRRTASHAGALTVAAALCACTLAAPLLPWPAPPEEPSGRPPPLPRSAAAPLPWQAPVPVQDGTRTVLGPAAERALTAALDGYGATASGTFSVAAVELDGGASYHYAADERFSPGSTVKLDVLAILVLQAEQAGSAPSHGDLALAEAMMGRSDNDAADALFTRIGSYPGFLGGWTDLGLAPDSVEPFGRWGQGRTTAADRVAVLRAALTGDGPISADGRARIRTLMSGVADEQAWGVSAAADGAAALKNGWVPLERDGGRWAVNSTGLITSQGRDYLIAVLSGGHTDYGTGVACVEHVSTTVIRAMGTAIAQSSPKGPLPQPSV